MPLIFDQVPTPSSQLAIVSVCIVLIVATLLLWNAGETRANDATPAHNDFSQEIILGSYWLDDDTGPETNAPQDDVDEQEHVYCLGALATLVGGPGDDILIGTDGPDVILGRAGNDRIDGKGGHDILCAGSGDNLIIGGPGDDYLLGGDGVDQLIGGSGNDFLRGRRFRRPADRSGGW